MSSPAAIASLAFFPFAGADHHPGCIGDLAQSGGNLAPIGGAGLFDREGHKERDVVAVGHEGGGGIVTGRLEGGGERLVGPAPGIRSRLREHDVAAQGIGSELLDDGVVHHAVRAEKLSEQAVLEACCAGMVMPLDP